MKAVIAGEKWDFRHFWRVCIIAMTVFALVRAYIPAVDAQGGEDPDEENEGQSEEHERAQAALNALLPHNPHMHDPIPTDLSIVPDPFNSEASRTWGPDDERGNVNYITPSKVAAALRSVNGFSKLILIYHPLEPLQSGVNGRRFTMQTFRGRPPTTPSTNFNISSHERLMQSEVISNDPQHNVIGHIGTQVDGYTHMARNGLTYNGISVLNNDNLYRDFVNPGEIALASESLTITSGPANGYEKGDIEKIGPIITNGILLDLFAYKMEQLERAGQDTSLFPSMIVGGTRVGYSYTPEDVEGAMVRQGLSLQDFDPGDVILLRVGNGFRFWTEDPLNPRKDAADRAKYFGGGAGGPGIRACKWLVNRKPAMVGADMSGSNGPIEPQYQAVSGLGHAMYLQNGILIGENFDTEVLARECAETRVYKFTFSMTFLPIRGGTASTVSPFVLTRGTGAR